MRRYFLKLVEKLYVMLYDEKHIKDDINQLNNDIDTAKKEQLDQLLKPEIPSNNDLLETALNNFKQNKQLIDTNNRNLSSLLNNSNNLGIPVSENNIINPLNIDKNYTKLAQYLPKLPNKAYNYNINFQKGQIVYTVQTKQSLN